MLFLTIVSGLGPRLALAQDSTEANSWKSVTYGNGLFVAVATAGNHRVMTSSDGLNWTARDVPEANLWYSVTYGNGLFVAVSYDGTHRVMTSSDGITWTAATSSEQNQWASVTYGTSTFVAVSGGGTHEVMTSTDGTNWTAQDQIATGDGWVSVTYSSSLNLFVAVAGMSGTYHNNVMTSPDGVTWTVQDSSLGYSGSITYATGTFVSVGNSSANKVMTSPNGTTWTTRTAAAANAWTSVAYGNGKFVAVSNNGTYRVMTSADGITWATSTAAAANAWQSITYGNSLFVAVSSDGTNRVMTSPDGVTWTSSPIPVDGVDQITVTLDVTSGISITSPDDVTMSRNLSMTADTAVASSTWTVRTSNETGYNLTVKASTAPAMHNATNTVADYQTTGTPDTWSVSAGTAAFGFSAYGTDVAAAWGSDTSCQASSDVPSSNLKYSGFTTSTSSPVVSTRSATTSSDGVATTVCYAVGQNAYYIPSGTYTATITATAVNL